MPILKFEYDKYFWEAEISRGRNGFTVGKIWDDRRKEVPKDSPLGQKLLRFVTNSFKLKNRELAKAAENCCKRE